MKTSNVLAFLGGAAVGAIITLLTTPKTGSENRKIVADKLKTGAELSKKELRDLMAWVKDKIQENEIINESEEIEEKMGSSC